MKKDNSGSTIVEVMVSFVILLIIFVMFQSCFKIASNLFTESEDYINAEEQFNQEYLKKDRPLANVIQEYSDVQLVEQGTGTIVKLDSVVNEYSQKINGLELSIQYFDEK